MIEKNFPKKTNTEIITEKILNKIDNPKILNDLEKIPNEDLQALLISIFEQRTKKLKPIDILRQAKESRFLTQTKISLAEFNSFDNNAINILDDDVETIELSPLGPIGSVSVLTQLSQKNIISTVRNNEVLSDALPLLAIEYEKRRKARIKQNTDINNNSIHLFTSHRVVRAQKFDEIKGFVPHFRAIFLLSGNKFSKKWEPIEEYLEKHIDYYIRVIENAVSSKNFSVNKIKISFSNLKILENLIKNKELNRDLIMRNTQRSNFNLFKDNNINLPTNINNKTEISNEDLYKYEIKKPYEYLIRNCGPLLNKLQEKYPFIDFNFDLERIAGIGYYNDLCFKIFAQNKQGEYFPLSDGGFVDWTYKLTRSNNEFCMTSGFGSELFIDKFKNKKIKHENNKCTEIKER